MTPELSGDGWRVFRDPAGVPHVQADDVMALATGHGAVTAYDRVWHLEVLRARAESRSAELLGPEHVDADHLTAALEVKLTALRWWKAATPEDQQFLAGYANGVNSQLSLSWGRSGDVRRLDLARATPRPWQPWTPLAIHLDAHLLAGSLPERVWRHRVSTTLGEEWIPVLDAETPRGSGSNAWLIPADLSVSGAPLIAADPHRVVEESGPYQPVCLSAPGLRVRGLALTGLPGVPHFGRTETAAWAITAAMLTTEELSELTVERRHGGLVIAGTGEPLTERAVTLATGSGTTETRWVRRCSSGLVIPGDAAAERGLRDLPEGGRARLLVVRPARPRAAERAVAACRELLSASTVADVRAAWDGWAVPANDVVAADSSGACLHTVAGCSVTKHPSGQPHADVESFAGECLIRANQRPDNDRESARRLGCAPPHRARRARHLIDRAVAQQAMVRHEDLLAAQLDTHLDVWPALLQLLLGDAADDTDLSNAVDGAPEDTGSSGERGLTPGALRLRAELLAWSGSMAADSSTASLFALWRDEFTRDLADSDALRPLLGFTGLPPLWEPFVNPVARVGLALESIVAHGRDVGLDPRPAAFRALEGLAARPAASKPGDDARRANAAVLAGHTARSLGIPSDGTEPSWGRLHAFAPHRANPALPSYEPVPVGGDTDCLLSTGTIPGWGPGCARVPAARVLWDLADPAASWWITPDPVDRGTLGRAPVHRWASGDMDQALPWVPPGGLSPTTEPISLGWLTDGWAAIRRSVGPVEGCDQHPSTVADGQLRLRPVDPARDAELIHSWVRAERATHWGMNDLTLQQVRDLYAFIASTPTHHAWLIELGGRPIGIFQTYEPHADIVGGFYQVEPGDLGIHVLLAPARQRIPGLTNAIAALVLRKLLAQERTHRIVAEPDVTNDQALARLTATGFVMGPTIELPHKTGRLAFLGLR